MINTTQVTIILCFVVLIIVLFRINNAKPQIEDRNKFTVKRLAGFLGAIALFCFGSFFIYLAIKLYGIPKNLIDFLGFLAVTSFPIALLHGSWKSFKIGISPDNSLNLTSEQLSVKRVQDSFIFVRFIRYWAWSIILLFATYFLLNYWFK